MKYAVLMVPKMGLFYRAGKLYSGDGRRVYVPPTIPIHTSLKAARAHKKEIASWAEEKGVHSVIIQFEERG